MDIQIRALTKRYKGGVTSRTIHRRAQLRHQVPPLPGPGRGLVFLRGCAKSRRQEW